jgi:hypothetical protein
MKHIKKYKKYFITESVNIDEIKQYCEDVLLDIQDFGCDVSVVIPNTSNQEERNWIIIKILKKGNFSDSEKEIIGDCYEHIKNYLSTKNFVSKMNPEYSEDNNYGSMGMLCRFYFESNYNGVIHLYNIEKATKIIKTNLKFTSSFLIKGKVGDGKIKFLKELLPNSEVIDCSTITTSELLKDKAIITGQILILDNFDKINLNNINIIYRLYGFNRLFFVTNSDDFILDNALLNRLIIIDFNKL